MCLLRRTSRGAFYTESRLRAVELRTEFYFIRNRVIRSNYVLEKAERDVEFLKADIAALTRYYEESDVLAKR